MEIQNYRYLNHPIDVSEQFSTMGNIHFLADCIEEFNPKTGAGQLRYHRFERKGRVGFNMYSTPFEPAKSWSFPPAYSDDPAYPISVEFVSESIVRIRTTCKNENTNLIKNDKESIMLDGCVSQISVEPSIIDNNHIVYSTSKIDVIVELNPFHITIKDKNGKELTKTLHSKDSYCLQNYNPMPCSYVRSCEDMHKYPAITMQIHPGEHFYGCGESFTKLDKLGQKLVLWTIDANGVETDQTYKPIPFFISSRGYGIFYHTSCPATIDFGKEYAEAQTVYMGDENIDMFIFTGTPKEILSAYTELTGKSPVPPLWTFGLWMSRITYKSELEARDVAANLKKYKIPCDVIHLDTGWFEEDWLCNYKFSPSRFDDPQKMIADLRNEGYRICLWQIPYFTPKNELFRELVDDNLAVVNSDGDLPTDDAVMDLSNPATVDWYKEQLGGLFKIGVSAIKADFGEAAPLNGVYKSGKSGFAEHNLYPLRYNKAVYEATKEYNGDNQGIIWARSAWAGSQRYPLHWGGDCENTDMGMLSSLRGGLSLGASGFTYWSQDNGGFVRKSPEELYKRWNFMTIFTSHMRCHGQPPKEPWAYSEDFLASFRHLMELRYRLTPYVIAQSCDCSAKGLPMLRAMFIECPDDRTCDGMEDQYFFGNDILVAPLFENDSTRDVYLPEGNWIELGTNREFAGSSWHRISATIYPGLAFVRCGSVIPMVETAYTTDSIDWSTLHNVLFGKKPKRGLTIDVNTKGIKNIDNREPTISSEALEW